MAGGIWVIGEERGAGIARISAEVATLGRALGKASGLEVTGVVAGANAAALASELAAYLPRVLTLNVPGAAGAVTSGAVAPTLAALVEREAPAWILVGATPDGRDLAGMLSALLGWGVLVNAIAVEWGESGPSVEMGVFGGRLLTTSELTGHRGIVTIRPGTMLAEPLAAPGRVEAVTVVPSATLPAVTVVERIGAASAAAPIEDAKVIVAGGRGIGSQDAFGVVEALAEALGGAVGATRAAVDAGWIDFSQQIGQTGKTVKPVLYVAIGISGAIQHTVGIQGAGTVIAVNRDAEAPIIEFADLVVVGDLFQVVPAITAQLKARGG